MHLLFSIRCRRGLIGSMIMSLLLWQAAPLFAFDVFSSDKTEASSPALPGGTMSSSTFADIARMASPAVVNIATMQKISRRRRPLPFPMPGPSPFGEEDPFEEFFHHFFGDRPPGGQQKSLGSGSIISEDGYIITNNHVVGDADKITVRLSDKEEYTAKVIGTDEKTDLALIKVNAPHPLPTLPFGSSAKLRVGDWVLAIGNPFGLEQTVTAGIISAKDRVIGSGPYDDFLQTDASINPGNSGGPLLNLNGEVIGINSAIVSQSGGNIGIGFAIPIDLAKSIITQLKASGKVTRGWLGVAIQDITPQLAKSFGLKEPTGALVSDVTKHGPAEKAGIMRGDIITSFNGTSIHASQELPALVAQTPIGTKADITVLRNGNEHTFSVTIGKLTDELTKAEGGGESDATWGMTVANLTPDTIRRFQLDRNQTGVVVTDVEADSPAGAAGLRTGDVIQEVDRQPITSVEELAKALAEGKERNTLLLLVRRGENTIFVALSKSN